MSQTVKGTLILASTHIGNLEDTPFRTLLAIHSADLRIFEEDRPARQLFKLIREKGMGGDERNTAPLPYLKYNEHAPQDTLALLKTSLKEGKTAVYVSDQGCPSLADPGQALSALAYELGARVSVIPGPSAVTAAIAACPFPLASFFFAGFLPREDEKRKRELHKLLSWKVPLIILDTPYRLRAVLESCEAVFGKTRQAFLAIDISGEEEQFLVGNFSALIMAAEKIHKKNFVLVVDGTEIGRGGG